MNNGPSRYNTRVHGEQHAACKICPLEQQKAMGQGGPPQQMSEYCQHGYAYSNSTYPQQLPENNGYSYGPNDVYQEQFPENNGYAYGSNEVYRQQTRGYGGCYCGPDCNCGASWGEAMEYATQPYAQQSSSKPAQMDQGCHCHWNNNITYDQMALAHQPTQVYSAFVPEPSQAYTQPTQSYTQSTQGYPVAQPTTSHVSTFREQMSVTSAPQPTRARPTPSPSRTGPGGYETPRRALAPGQTKSGAVPEKKSQDTNKSWSADSKKFKQPPPENSGWNADVHFQPRNQDDGSWDADFESNKGDPDQPWTKEMEFEMRAANEKLKPKGEGSYEGTRDQPPWRGSTVIPGQAWEGETDKTEQPELDADKIPMPPRPPDKPWKGTKDRKDKDVGGVKETKDKAKWEGEKVPKEGDKKKSSTAQQDSWDAVKKKDPSSWKGDTIIPKEEELDADKKKIPPRPPDKPWKGTKERKDPDLPGVKKPKDKATWEGEKVPQDSWDATKKTDPSWKGDTVIPESQEDLVPGKKRPPDKSWKGTKTREDPDLPGTKKIPEKKTWDGIKVQKDPKDKPKYPKEKPKEPKEKPKEPKEKPKEPKEKPKEPKGKPKDPKEKPKEPKEKPKEPKEKPKEPKEKPKEPKEKPRGDCDEKRIKRLEKALCEFAECCGLKISFCQYINEKETPSEMRIKKIEEAICKLGGADTGFCRGGKGKDPSGPCKLKPDVCKPVQETPSEKRLRKIEEAICKLLGPSTGLCKKDESPCSKDGPRKPGREADPKRPGPGTDESKCPTKPAPKQPGKGVDPKRPCPRPGTAMETPSERRLRNIEDTISKFMGGVCRCAPGSKPPGPGPGPDPGSCPVRPCTAPAPCRPRSGVCTPGVCRPSTAASKPGASPGKAASGKPGIPCDPCGRPCTPFNFDVGCKSTANTVNKPAPNYGYFERMVSTFHQMEDDAYREITNTKGQLESLRSGQASLDEELRKALDFNG